MNLLKKFYKVIVPERIRNKLIHAMFKMRAFKYYGSEVTCNCCGKNFSRFLPFGSPIRPNADCPYCHSLERNRLLLFYLENETDFFREKLKVLHFAPEYMLEKKFKKLPNLEYISADLNPALAMRKVDITNIDFPDNHFDVVICSHVLMHVPNEKKALSELFRITKPSGFGLIQTRTDAGFEKTFEVEGVSTPEERFKAYGDKEIFRIHGNDFKNRLTELGFKATLIEYAKTISEANIKKYGLQKDDIIFLCEK